MPDPAEFVKAALREHMELELKARALRQAIYMAADPAAIEVKVHTELAKIESKLKELQSKKITDVVPEGILPEKPPKPKGTTRGGKSVPTSFEITPKSKGMSADSPPITRSGRTVGELALGAGLRPESLSRSVPGSLMLEKLGPQTTGLNARYEIRMAPVPTGVYHLLDSEENPLVEVTVECVSLPPQRKSARVKIQSYIEGLSAVHVKTFELKKGEKKSFRMLPTLLPDKVQYITEVQRATLHVIVEDLDGVTELHDSVTMTMLARNSGLNAMIDPVTKKNTDLTRYYGAWVTPHAEPILLLLRQAADKTKDKTISGYLTGKSDIVADQAKALFDTLKSEHNITYINSVIDFGAGASYFSQRARLPRESIKQKSANCLDGTLLFASLLEAATLKPAIVLFPGHALVAWQNKDRDIENATEEEILKNWTFLETTWIGSRNFDEAVKFGRDQVEREIAKSDFVMHKLMDLRLDGIFPME
jgi:hypothetical protein